MKIAFGLNLSPEINRFLNLFNQIELGMNNITEKKNYGNAINELFIGLICVAPQFEPFYKPRRPKYIKEKKEYEKDGFSFAFEKTFEYEIKLNYEDLKNAKEEDAERMIAEEILSSLQVFDKMKSKIKDFDEKRFKADIERYFREHHFL